jgi:hypothetical protein
MHYVGNITSVQRLRNVDFLSPTALFFQAVPCAELWYTLPMLVARVSVVIQRLVVAI